MLLQELRPDIRATLVDWLMEVCCHLGLLRHTCHSAVSLLDRFLSAPTTTTGGGFPRKKLQLLGAPPSCLLLPVIPRDIIASRTERETH